MDARTLLMLFDALFLLGMVAWLGAILFFSFGVAPIIFGVLESSQAARFVRALFPRYYAWGATAATVALAAFTCRVLVQPGYRGPGALAQILLMIAVVLINLHCGNSLTPRINAARDAGPEQSARFDRLHRRSVRLNGAMLLIGVALIGLHAVRPEPGGQGVIEPSPIDRARRGSGRWERGEGAEGWRRAPIADDEPAASRSVGGPPGLGPVWNRPEGAS